MNPESITKRILTRFAGHGTLIALLFLPPLARAFDALPTNNSAWSGSAGLFVGIRQFDIDSGLPQLGYTVDDAVALADIFTSELQLLPPAHVWLALSGDPASPECVQQLAGLKKLGVHVVAATQKSLRHAVNQACADASDEKGLLIMSFNTHGYQNGNETVLMPSDGESAHVMDSGIRLAYVRDAVNAAVARKRLVMVDACREPVAGNARGDELMTGALFKSLAESAGSGTFLSCSRNQKSYENKDFGHGVFTHFLLEALRGQAASDPTDGLIRLGAVSDYVAARTVRFTHDKEGADQAPYLGGDPSAREIPLAVDPRQREESKKLREHARQAGEYVMEANQNNPGVMDPETFGRLATLLTTTSGGELQHLVVKCEEISGHTSDKQTFEDFVLWFKAKYPAGASVAPVRPIQPLTTETASLETPPPPIVDKPAKPTPPARKASLIIIMERPEQAAAQNWNRFGNQFRDALLKALLASGKFSIRADANRNGPPPDYILKVTASSFGQTVTDDGFSASIIRINQSSSTPKASLNVSWELDKSGAQTPAPGRGQQATAAPADIVQTDSVSGDVKGRTVSWPNNRKPADQYVITQGNLPLNALVLDVASKLADAVEQVQLPQ